MFRKTVGGLTASAVVAGLAAVGVVAAAPARPQPAGHAEAVIQVLPKGKPVSL